MKESITKFDLEAAFKALDEIEMPKVDKVKANRPALTEIFSRKSKFDALMEEYYDINDMSELDDAKEAREAEVAQAKLARIEKIVDLDAESPEDLLPSYVGKFIMQCPQCMTLFYKNPEDIEAAEEDPNIVNVNEICQHCGNDAGYTLIGKVGEATAEEQAEYREEETVDVTSTEEADLPDEPTEATDDDFDLDADLEALDLDLDDEEEDTAEDEEVEEHFKYTGSGKILTELLDTELHEGLLAETKQAIQALMLKFAENDENGWAKTIAEVLAAIPDDALERVFKELSDKFKDLKLDDTARGSIAKAGNIQIGEETDTVGKLLDLLDPYSPEGLSPEAIKAAAAAALAILSKLEPSPVVEIISAAVSALPAEAVAKILNIMARVSAHGVLAAAANKIYKSIKNKTKTVDAEETAETHNSLTEEINLDVSADEFEKLISSPEFKKPMSDAEARAMIDEIGSDNKVKESIEVNHETLRFAVINPDGTYAGVPCTSEEEARELVAQREGRIIVKLCALNEGIFDLLKTRNAKADWILKNALDGHTKKFNTFVVVGYTDTYSNGKQITSAPINTKKDLVVGMKQPITKSNYKEADNIAKGWSMRQGNGPAFIYLAKSPEYTKAVFLCEYFKGELKYDQLDTYFKEVKKDLAGKKLLDKTNMNQAADDETALEDDDFDF